MIINQSNLHGLTTGYSAAFNKALSEVSPDYKDIATVTSSSTAANDYACVFILCISATWQHS